MSSIRFLAAWGCMMLFLQRSIYPEYAEKGTFMAWESFSLALSSGINLDLLLSAASAITLAFTQTLSRYARRLSAMNAATAVV